MAREEGDDETLEAIEQDVQEIRKVIESMEFRRMFNNPMDPNNCFIDIQAAPAVRKPRTGLRCCCASTCAIASARVLKLKSSSSPTAR